VPCRERVPKIVQPDEGKLRGEREPLEQPVTVSIPEGGMPPVLMGEDRACVGQCVDSSRAARPQLAPCDQVRMVGAPPLERARAVRSPDHVGGPHGLGRIVDPPTTCMTVSLAKKNLRGIPAGVS